MQLDLIHRWNNARGIDDLCEVPLGEVRDTDRPYTTLLLQFDHGTPESTNRPRVAWASE